MLRIINVITGRDLEVISDMEPIVVEIMIRKGSLNCMIIAL